MATKEFSEDESCFIPYEEMGKLFTHKSYVVNQYPTEGSVATKDTPVFLEVVTGVS